MQTPTVTTPLDKAKERVKKNRERYTSLGIPSPSRIKASVPMSPITSPLPRSNSMNVLQENVRYTRQTFGKKSIDDKPVKLKKQKQVIENEPRLKMDDKELEEIEKDFEVFDNSFLISRVKPTVEWNSEMQQHKLFHPLTFDFSTIPHWQTIRNLEAEGFHVELPPKMSAHNMDVLLKRLRVLEEHYGFQWMNSSNQIAIIPDPLNYTLTRPKLDVAVEEFITRQPEKPTPCLLQVQLSSIHFVDHPLLTEEIRLGLELEELVKALNQREKQKINEYLTTRLETLRRTFQELAVITETPTTNRIEQERLKQAKAENDSRRYQLLKDIRSTRLLRDTEAQTDRMLEFKILKLWDKIKSLRSTQGFISSRVRLRIILQETIETNDFFDQQMENELKELNEMHSIEQSKEMQAFEKRLTEWNRRPPEQESQEKPEPPKQKELNIKKIKSQISKRLHSSFRPAGAAVFKFLLDQQEVVTDITSCPKDEQIRRAKVDATFIFIKLFVNDQQVMRTSSRPFLLSNFSSQDVASIEKGVEVSQGILSIGMRIAEKPFSIRVEIYEAGVYGDEFLAEANVPLPGPLETTDAADRESDALIFTGIPYEDRWVGGQLTIKASWEQDIQQPSAILTQKGFYDPLATHGPPGIVTLAKLMEWLCDVTMDPNDPRNSSLLPLQQSALNVQANNYIHRYTFRLGLPEWLRVKTIGVTGEMSLRQTLLDMRSKQQIVIKGPASFNENEIIYEKVVDSLKDENAAKLLKKDDAQLEIGFLKRVRAYQLISKAKITRPKIAEDFVSEATLPPYIQQQNPLAILFAPNRKLNPMRTERSQQTTTCPESCKLMVQVMRGYNLPTRIARNQKNSNPVCHPFVEVSFQYKHARTTTALGKNAIWNETVSLDITAPNDDFRPESLLESDIGTDIIFINLYDEVLVDLIQDSREKESIIHQRREKNWLGSIQVPFSSVWESLRVDGEFMVKLPFNLLGYERNVSEEQARATSLRLFITLDPPLAQPAQLDLEFSSDEDPAVLKHAQKWLDSLDKKRAALATVMDMNGKTTLVTRFLAPQPAPSEFTTIQQISRFVSLIPWIPNRAAFGADIVLWSTSQQVFEMTAANTAEHAIILANFLSHYDCWIVLGRGIPEGSTAYVLIKTTNFILINPITGQEFDLQDPLLPLKEVGSVFNAKNVWANIQPTTVPSQMNFELKDTKSWKPLFGSFPAPEVASVKDPLQLLPTTASHIHSLEINLEKVLVQKIESWRSGQVTRWNRMCSRTFKSLLTRCESNLVSSISIEDTLANNTELNSIQNVYKMIGFPMNMSYTDVNAVCSSVFSSSVHMNRAPGVEFALAVHCHGYPGNIISVWVFVASLTRII